jgi:phosphoribosylpyrophosphate synthetase
MFKHIRSFVGKFFDENQQMWVVMYLSQFYWFLRKYFLAVEIKYPEEFLTNWSIIKHYSSQDKERNFTVYQMIKVHNEIFKGKKTNLIEFGVDRGGTLTTISKFAKDESRIYALDSFGYYADDIKENVTKYDPHYTGKYKPFTKKTRFKNFDYLTLEKNLNEILVKKKK